MHLLKEEENCHFLHKVKAIKVSTVFYQKRKTIQQQEEGVIIGISWQKRHLTKKQK